MTQVVATHGVRTGIHIDFTTPPPQDAWLFGVCNNTGTVFYTKLVGKDTQELDFNLPYAPPQAIVFDFPTQMRAKTDKFRIKKVATLNIPTEVNRPYSLKDIKFQIRDKIEHTPARHNIRTGIIEISRDDWNKYDVPTRRYLLLHEIAHYYYETETYADACAYCWMLREGFGESQILYAMQQCLRESKMKSERMKSIVNLRKKFIECP